MLSWAFWTVTYVVDLTWGEQGKDIQLSIDGDAGEGERSKDLP